MRILYVSTERLDKHGGTPLRIREIVTHWARMGHDVEVLAPNYGGRATPEGWPVPVISIPLPGRHLVTFAAFDLSSFLTAAWFAWRRRADIVVSIGGFGSALLYRSLHLLGKRYVVEVNGVADVEVTRMKIPAWAAQLCAWAIRHSGMYRRADLFVCVAPGIREELTSRWSEFERRSIVIENGVDPARFAHTERASARRALGIEPDTVVFGFIGSLCPWHGTEDLITATRILRDRGRSGFKTLIVGDGERFADLQRQARDAAVEDLVTFTGGVPSARVPEYAAAFDVGCQVHNDPSVGRLGNSMKFWEYLAAGLPVIVSDLSEASRYIGPGSIGWTFHGGDPRRLADRMEHVLDHPDLLAPLGRSSRELAREHSWEVVARKMIEAFEGLLRSRDSAPR